MKNQYVSTAVIALGAFAACVFLQKMFPIPVIGAYLPGGAAAK